MWKELLNLLPIFASWERKQSGVVHDLYPNPRINKMLLRVWEDIKDMPNFPHNICEDASRAVSKATGMQITPGYFFVDSEVGRYVPHYFCVDREGRIVDLTADQFNSRLNKRHRLNP